MKSSRSGKQALIMQSLYVSMMMEMSVLRMQMTMLSGQVTNTWILKNLTGMNLSWFLAI